MGIFKPCDIRGVYPDHIDENIVRKIGRAIATKLGGGRVIAGGDVRLSTPSLKAALIDGLRASGCDAIDIGCVPTPSFYFARKKLGIDAGVMVTASHNPPKYNGLKITLGPKPITPGELAEVHAIMEAESFADGNGSVENIEIISDYIKWITGYAAKIASDDIEFPKVALDCGSGCYSEIAPKIFSLIGVEHTDIFCTPDGSFPHRSPDSSNAANLGELRKRVVEENASLGIAFDGDGDRVSFIDGNGEMLSADQAMSVLAKYSAAKVRSGENVALDIKCSSAVSEMLRDLGAVPLRERSGHTFIKTKMIEKDAAFGGEISGHFFYRELGGGDDGLFSAILMCGVVAKKGSLADLVSLLPRYASTPDIRLHVESPKQVVERIENAFSGMKIDRTDGVKIIFDGGWALARVSVTEPVVTLRFEGREQTKLEQIIDRFVDAAPELAEGIRAAITGR